MQHLKNASSFPTVPEPNMHGRRRELNTKTAAASRQLQQCDDSLGHSYCNCLTWSIHLQTMCCQTRLSSAFSRLIGFGVQRIGANKTGYFLWILFKKNREGRSHYRITILNPHLHSMTVRVPTFAPKHFHVPFPFTCCLHHDISNPNWHPFHRTTGAFDLTEQPGSSKFMSIVFFIYCLENYSMLINQEDDTPLRKHTSPTLQNQNKPKKQNIQ